MLTKTLTFNHYPAELSAYIFHAFEVGIANCRTMVLKCFSLYSLCQNISALQGLKLYIHVKCLDP